MGNNSRLKSTFGMWIVFFVFLSILLSISIYFIHNAIIGSANDTLPTNVYTIGEDVFSMKTPNGWSIYESSTTKDGINFSSANGYETFSITPSDKNFEQESAIYLIELCEMFDNSLSYTQSTLGSQKINAVQVMLNNTYYFCGVRESGNTVIRFMYTASIMLNEPSRVDEVVKSINYRRS